MQIRGRVSLLSDKLSCALGCWRLEIKSTEQFFSVDQGRTDSIPCFNQISFVSEVPGGFVLLLFLLLFHAIVVQLLMSRFENMTECSLSNCN